MSTYKLEKTLNNNLKITWKESDVEKKIYIIYGKITCICWELDYSISTILISLENGNSLKLLSKDTGTSYSLLEDLTKILG